MYYYGMNNREKIYSIIERYWFDNYCAPTVRFIAEAMGGLSTNTVHHHIHKLAAENRLMLSHNGRPIPYWVQHAISVQEVLVRGARDCSLAPERQER